MKSLRLPCRPCLAIAALVTVAGSPAAADERRTPCYQEHCAACHGETRLGGVGPALLPENLERLRKPEALNVIRDGRVATQMPGFGDKLSADEAQQLAEWIYTPVVPAPVWGENRSAARMSSMRPPPALPARRGRGLKGADPLNLFIVVETGDHHVSVLDGDKLERLHRFPSRYALHGGPKFSPDGRFVYFASRDGWISKFDLYNLVVVAEVRAGLNTRNAAVSGDGKWVWSPTTCRTAWSCSTPGSLAGEGSFRPGMPPATRPRAFRRSMMRHRARASSLR
jgi:cytochrome c553